MDLVNQAFPIAMLIAAIFGLLSFLSPCVLPIVPAYLAYMSGVSIGQIKEGNGQSQLIRTSLFFVLGLSTVFMIMALTVNRLATAFLQNQEIFSLISGAIIIFFGLHFLGIFKVGFLNKEIRASADSNEKSIFGAYLLGLAFALGWSPCLGPALSAILTMVAGQENAARGIGLMALYALGLGIPFVLAAVFMQKFLQHSSRLNKHIPKIEKAMGILLIFVGIMMLTGSFSDFAFFLNETFPVLQNFG